VTVRDCGDQGAVRRAVSDLAHVPFGGVRVVEVSDHPMLPGGKVDQRGIVALAEAGLDKPQGSPDSLVPRSDSVERLYAVTLHRDRVPHDATFASLGGDSLSYVEVSLRLESLIGDLPAAWHVTPVARLQELADAAARGTSRPAGEGTGDATTRTAYGLGGPDGRLARALRRRTVETSVWLRALAILLIVGTHADLFSLQGTAHALLVLVGYNVARFALTARQRRNRLTALARGLVRVVAPTLAVVVPAHVVWGYYEPRNLFLANWVFGEQRLGPPWRFWFIEAIVLALVVAIALTAVPAVARVERRWPFGLPVALTLAAFTVRLELFELPVPRMQGSALVVLFLFFLGWAIARVSSPRERWVATAGAVLLVGTFSGNPARDALSLAVVLALVWWPTTRIPSGLVPLVQVLAASSLFVYVIHWQVLEHLWGKPLLAFLGSMAAGVAYWLAWTRVLPWAGGKLSTPDRKRGGALSVPAPTVVG
jgi:hypothetical protein